MLRVGFGWAFFRQPCVPSSNWFLHIQFCNVRSIAACGFKSGKYFSSRTAQYLPLGRTYRQVVYYTQFTKCHAIFHEISMLGHRPKNTTLANSLLWSPLSNDFIEPSGAQNGSSYDSHTGERGRRRFRRKNCPVSTDNGLGVGANVQRRERQNLAVSSYR